jgi:hypothetical protein
VGWALAHHVDGINADLHRVNMIVLFKDKASEDVFNLSGLIPHRLRRIVGWALAHHVDGISADLH